MFITYPESAAPACVVPVTSVQPIPEPVPAIVIPPADSAILMPAPAVKVAGTGVAPVEPINTWPFVMLAVITGTPADVVTKVALLAPVTPPNEPALLYCISLLEPPTAKTATKPST